MRFWQLIVAGTGLTALLLLLSWSMYGRLTRLDNPANRPGESTANSVATTADNLTTAPSGQPTQDPFTAAVQLAQDAVTLGETAKSPVEWFELSGQWQQASELMSIVPPEDDRYEVAQDRAKRYLDNSDYARQKAESLSPLP